MEDKIMTIVKMKPGISVSRICREINHRGLSYCVLKKCYANIRKQKKYGKIDHACKLDRFRLFSIINKLEKKDMIKTRREKKTDTRQNRGWDWMRGCYKPEDYPPDIPVKVFSK